MDQMIDQSVAGAFSVSPRAAARIAEIVAGQAGAGQAGAGQAGAGQVRPDTLRVAVLAGGCSGLQYRFELDGAQADDDLVVERDGARVLVDRVSLELLAGAELDFVDKLMGAHFVIHNPNATSACGCGTSFSVD